MKILFVGDIHNHKYIFDDIKRLDEKYKFDRIIFLGDYVDDWGDNSYHSVDTLNTILQLKQSNSEKYTLILGNHELSYLGFPCSGHNYILANELQNLLNSNIELFDLYTIASCDNNYICTHAGITNSYINGVISKVIPGLKSNDWEKGLAHMNSNKLESLDLLKYASTIRGGQYEYSSMMWCDKREHEYFSACEKYWIPYQIVGHTPVKTISTLSGEDFMMYFIDTHSTYRDTRPFGDKSYLVWNNTEFMIEY